MLMDKNLKVLNIQEEDRQRIARDLHDTSLQNLAHLVHKIELCGMYIDVDPIKAKLELALVGKNLRDVIEEIRNIIFDLRPMSFDDLGLKFAFEQMLEKFNESKSYQIKKEIEDVSCDDDIILVGIFRVVQECLNNIKKHSNADSIFFSCRKENEFCVIDIEDNGEGFTKEEVEYKKDKHFGISVMEERISLLGGSINISSIKEKGTQIHIEVPLT